MRSSEDLRIEGGDSAAVRTFASGPLEPWTASAATAAANENGEVTVAAKYVPPDLAGFVVTRLVGVREDNLPQAWPLPQSGGGQGGAAEADATVTPSETLPTMSAPSKQDLVSATRATESGAKALKGADDDG